MLETVTPQAMNTQLCLCDGSAFLSSAFLKFLWDDLEQQNLERAVSTGNFIPG